LNCLPAGIPFDMFIAPFKILQGQSEMMILLQQDPPRQIYFDDGRFPKTRSHRGWDIRPENGKATR
jgi:hypothetical protein